MTWVLTTISLIGNFFNCRKVRAGFVLWLICNTGWLIYDVQNAIYARAILDAVQSVFCIYGLFEWSRRKEK